MRRCAETPRLAHLRLRVFITCGGFTSGAEEAAARAHSRIVLIDGEQLAEFMIDHGAGVADHKTYIVKKLDGDYFGEA